MGKSRLPAVVDLSRLAAADPDGSDEDGSSDEDDEAFESEESEESEDDFTEEEEESEDEYAGEEELRYQRCAICCFLRAARGWICENGPLCLFSVHSLLKNSSDLVVPVATPLQ